MTAEERQEYESPTLQAVSPSLWQRIWNLDDNWLELTAVILLSVASLAAAWGGYQSARWNGQQSELYSQASAIRVESTRATTTGYMYVMNDIDMFNRWAEAYARGDTDLQGFYRDRFSPELETAVVAWLATSPLASEDSPSSPYRMPEYGTPWLDTANDLEDKAVATFEEGQQAAQQGDEYVLTTVFLALVLFFAGISSRLLWRPSKVPVLLLATTVLIISLVRLGSFPIQ